MPPHADYPDAIVVHPDAPDTLFLTAGVGWPSHWYEIGKARGKIARSRDGGNTWQRLLGGLPNGQRALFSALTIEAWPGGSALYAVDTDGEVFESTDEGDNWTIIAEVPPVSKGEFYRAWREIAASSLSTTSWSAKPLANGSPRWSRGAKRSEAWLKRRPDLLDIAGEWGADMPGKNQRADRRTILQHAAAAHPGIVGIRILRKIPVRINRPAADDERRRR